MQVPLTWTWASDLDMGLTPPRTRACPRSRAVLHNLRYDEAVATFHNASGLGTATGDREGASTSTSCACTAISFRTGGLQGPARLGRLPACLPGPARPGLARPDLARPGPAQLAASSRLAAGRPAASGTCRAPLQSSCAAKGPPPAPEPGPERGAPF
jgi:hypothetical protein